MNRPTLEQFIYNLHSKQTADSYLYQINHFLQTNKKAAKYKHSDIVAYMENLIAKHPKANYRRTILAAIKKYYDYLVLYNYRKDHPCKKLVIKGGSRYIQVQDLFTSDELQLLFNRENRYQYLEVRNKIIIGLMIYQALTSEELTRLTVSNIHFDKGEIYIKRSHNLSRRKLALRASQITELQLYINEHRKKLLKSKTNRLIIGTRGVPITVDGIHSIIDQLKGLFPDRKLSPATIRQSVISNLLNEGKYSLEDVQQFAGHKWVSTTANYIRPDADQQRRIINQFHPLG